MHDDFAARTAIHSLLASQLLAAMVYSDFILRSGEAEREIWEQMLDDELEHVAHLRQLLHGGPVPNLRLPEINVLRMRESCEKIIALGRETFLLRLEGALRLECVELDYGLEGMAARRLRNNEIILDYPGDVRAHLNYLLGEAKRYTESRNIGLQIRRLNELLETSLTETTVKTRTNSTRIKI